MKKSGSILIFLFLLCHLSFASSVIRVNQLGYLPESLKSAVYLSDTEETIRKFQLIDHWSGRVLFTGIPKSANASIWGKKKAYLLDFSSVIQTGSYLLKAGSAVSPVIVVSTDVYNGSADFILQYMRQQRCGFNPFLNDSCHTSDGLIVDHPQKSGEWMDAKGGWHDASDYLQYTLTSANAVYQMLFAFQQNPSIYKDNYLASGLPGSNGIPDILDEAKWGLDWLLKMNPQKNEMYYQIADDRDHLGFRLPNKDKASYGMGKYRPVYFVTGKPYGTGSRRNRTTGVSSTAAKFASSFALASTIFKEMDPALSAKLKTKAVEAWEFAKSDPGVCQTACVVSPYFYEEENYTDDMELAAVTLSKIDQSDDYSKSANKYGELEQVTPWMELHRARHYQYYPFVNLGHALLAQSKDTAVAKTYLGFMKKGLQSLENYAKDDPFPIGIPFIWCSNNLVVAAATQAILYRQISGDTHFLKLETALIDWLFGCNPWGKAMICGLPSTGDYPLLPHSAVPFLLKKTTTGGLIDGPVYRHIYESLLGLKLFQKDKYAEFQGGPAVYHDDMGDYSTNEPTMDGTASLSFLLSTMEASGKAKTDTKFIADKQGAIVRMNPKEKCVYLIFSAHEFGEGGSMIRDVLKKYGASGSFFFTGDFYRNKQNSTLIKQLIADGHYVGAHSDKHLLYADWTKRDSTLITKEEFEKDLRANYREMNAFGIRNEKALLFLAPYEWYNKETISWGKQLGLQFINFTPGIRTNADYTTPDMPGYRSSDQIMADVKRFCEKDPDGLNGTFILIHLGTSPNRTDKFYSKLDNFLVYLQSQGLQMKNIENINRNTGVKNTPSSN